nr:hypothetical protein [Tanacetum cinerariifolium]
MLGDYIASAPLTPLVKPGSGIRPIAMGTVWRHLVSKVNAVMIGHYLDGYLDGIQFGVGWSGGGDAIIHVVNRLIEGHGDDVGLSMLLVDFKNAFSLVYREPLSTYLDDGTIVGDILVVGKVLELIMKDGPRCGLHINVDKTKGFWPKEDSRSRLKGVFLPNISRPLHVVKLLGGPASVDFDFSSEFVMKRVAKTIGLMDVVARINDPQCELLLLHAYTDIFKLYFSMRTCPLRFGDWLWRLATLPFTFGGLGVYSAACSKVFAGDIYRDHAVSCAGITGIKHRHNVMRDSLVDIYYRLGILAGKKIDIGLERGCDKPLRLADMLFYLLDRGLDVYRSGWVFSFDINRKWASKVRIVWFSFGSFGGGSFGSVSFGSSAKSKNVVQLRLLWRLLQLLRPQAKNLNHPSIVQLSPKYRFGIGCLYHRSALNVRSGCLLWMFALE